jgi:hypothetical protein
MVVKAAADTMSEAAGHLTGPVTRRPA